MSWWQHKLFLLYSWSEVPWQQTWALCSLGGSSGCRPCDGNTAPWVKCRHSQPVLRQASCSAPAGVWVPPSPGETVLPKAGAEGCPCQCISGLLRAMRPAACKPCWSWLLWAGLRSEEACPRANLPCLTLLWPSAAGGGSGRMLHKAFQVLPGRHPVSQTFHLFPSTLLPSF